MEPLPIESVIHEGGEVEYSDRRSGLLIAAGVAAIAVVLGGAAWFGRDGSAEIIGATSADAAPPVTELEWSAPIDLGSVADIRAVDVSRGEAFAIVDGWLARSDDMVDWTHLAVPTGLERTEQIHVGYSDVTFEPVIAGRIIDYDVNNQVIVALVSTEERAPSQTECSPKPVPPAARLYSSFDRGETWTQVDTDHLGDVDTQVRVRVDGNVASNGVTAVAHTRVWAVVDPQCGPESFLTQPVPIERFLVISPDLVTRRAVGTPGPILTSVGGNYLTGYGGVPPQESTNNGQSFSPTRTSSGRIATLGDMLTRSREDWIQLSLDHGTNWTARNTRLREVADATRWNGSAFVVGWTKEARLAAGDDAPFAAVLSNSFVSDEWDELADFARLHDPQIVALGDALAVIGNPIADDGTIGAPVLYLGTRP